MGTGGGGTHLRHAPKRALPAAPSAGNTRGAEGPWEASHPHPGVVPGPVAWLAAVGGESQGGPLKADRLPADR